MRYFIFLVLFSINCFASPNTMQGVQFCPLRLNATTNASVQAWYDPNSPLNTLNGAGMSQLKNLAPDDRENWLLWSEDFTKSPWIDGTYGLNAFGANDTGAAGAGSFLNTSRTLDPNGGNNATFYQENSALSYHTQQPAYTLKAGQYILSCSAKPAGRDWFFLVIGSTSAGGGAYFDVLNGVAATNHYIVGSATVDATSIVPEANGFYRCSVTVTMPADDTIYPQTYIAQTNALPYYTGDNTSGLFIYGAQLRRASKSPAYVKTEAIRYVVEDRDLNQSTAASQPLLSRADNRGNYLLQTESLASPWSGLNGGSGVLPVVTPNYTNAPDSSVTAARLQLDAGPNAFGDYSYFVQNVTIIPSGIAIVPDVWLRTVDGSTKTVGFSDANSFIFNTTLTVTGTWQKFSSSGTSVGGTLTWALLVGNGFTSASVDLLVWHPSLRQSSWSSDYIATTATPAYPGQNGQRVLVFDGTDDYLKTATFPLVQPTTVVGVLEQVSWVNDTRFFDGFSVNTGAFLDSPSSPTVVGYAGNIISSLNPTVGNPFVLTFQFNGASSFMQQDNLAQTTGNAGTDAMNGFTLGADGNNTKWSSIRTADLLLLNRTLTAAEQSYLVQGLARKAGVNVW